MKYLNDISYKDCVGKVCKSKSSGDFKESKLIAEHEKTKRLNKITDVLKGE